MTLVSTEIATSSVVQTERPTITRSKKKWTPARTSVTPSKPRPKRAVGVEPTLTVGTRKPAARSASAAATVSERSRSAQASISSTEREEYEVPAWVRTPWSREEPEASRRPRDLDQHGVAGPHPGAVVVGVDLDESGDADAAARAVVAESAVAASGLSRMTLRSQPLRTRASMRGSFTGARPTAYTMSVKPAAKKCSASARVDDGDRAPARPRRPCARPPRSWPSSHGAAAPRRGPRAGRGSRRALAAALPLSRRSAGVSSVSRSATSIALPPTWPASPRCSGSAPCRGRPGA